MKPFNPTPQKINKKERDFVPYLEAHFLINDIAGKFLKNTPLEEKEQDFIHNLFLEIQDEYNNDIVNSLMLLKNKQILTRVEKGIIGCYFLVAEQIGPKSDMLFKDFIEQKVSLEEFSSVAATIQIPESVREIIVYAYKKLINTEIIG